MDCLPRRLFLTDSGNADELKRIIVKIRSVYPKINVSIFFSKNFLRSINSKKYNDLIIGKR